MLLDILRPCLISRTTFTDNGITVNVRPQRGELVKFFVVDERSNPGSTLREILGMQGRICDLVVYYLKESSPEKVFCFVELKGKKIDDAVEQILDTFEALEGSSEHSERIKWKALYLNRNRFSDKAGPRNYKSFKSEIRR